MFLTAVVLVVFKGMEYGTKTIAALSVLGIAGFGFEYFLHLKAERRKPICRGCVSAYSIYKNSDRPNDTEYLYVCENCRSYINILDSTQATDPT